MTETEVEIKSSCDQGERLLRWAALVLVAITLLRIGLTFAMGSGLTHESGVLSGLAMDLRNGVFYRPLFSDLGYGGTRYGPLHIAMQAGLIRLGVGVIAAGFVLTFVATVALVSGVYILLRRLNVGHAWAAPGAVLFLAGGGIQYAVSLIRADLLPAAMSVWGLAIVAGILRSQRPVILAGVAGVFFALAGLAKMTAVFGAGAAFLWLLVNRRVGAAVVMAVVAAIIGGVGMGVVQWASEGRYLINIRQCANCGRAMYTLGELPGRLREVFLGRDVPGTLLVGVSVMGWIFAGRERWGLAGFMLVVTLPMTVGMFFSPGLDRNQLIDLEVAAVVFAVAALGRGGLRPMPWVAVLAGLVLLSSARIVWDMRRDINWRLDNFAAVGVMGDRSGRPIFSDQALAPVARGERPFLLDDFTFPAVKKNDPGALADLDRRLGGGAFSAVILRHDLSAPKDRDELRWVFGGNFDRVLLSRYRLVYHLHSWDDLWVYAPEGRSDE